MKRERAKKKEEPGKQNETLIFEFAIDVVKDLNVMHSSSMRTSLCALRAFTTPTHYAAVCTLLPYSPSSDLPIYLLPCLF